MNQKFKKLIINFLLFAIGFVSIWPAIQNGFPLVYSDSGTYIEAAYNHVVPVDRPIFYCFFVRFISLSHSLWFVVIAQALILYFVIYESVCMFTKTNAFLLSSIIVCTLSFTTGLSNYTSQIMPDIFTSICFIGFGMILTSEKMRWKEIILIVLVVFAIMTSFSNLLVMIGLFMISVIFLFLRITSIKLVTKAFVVILIPLIIILSVNKSYTGKYQISKSSNVSILGRMIETGVVKKYLTKNCNTHSYSLCDQINNIPGSCSQFLWDENSPLYDTACLHKSWNYCWEVKNKEYGRLIKDIITTPDYLKQLTVIYIKDFVRQIVDFKIGILVPMREGSAPQNCINRRFPNELKAYKNANQYGKIQEYKTISLIQLAVVLLSLLSILVLFIFNKKLQIRRDHKIFIIIIIFEILGNAMTVNLFSTVVDRYQARVIWIIPLICSLMIYHYFLERYIIKDVSYI